MKTTSTQATLVDYQTRIDTAGKKGIGDAGLFYLVKTDANGFVEARYEASDMTAKPFFAKKRVNELEYRMQHELRHMEKAVVHRDRLVLALANKDHDNGAIEHNLKGMILQNVPLDKINFGIGTLRESNQSQHKETNEQFAKSHEDLAKACHRAIGALLEVWANEERTAPPTEEEVKAGNKVVEAFSKLWAGKKAEPSDVDESTSKTTSKRVVSRQDEIDALQLLQKGIEGSLKDRGIPLLAPRMATKLASNSSASNPPARTRSSAVSNTGVRPATGSATSLGVPANRTQTTTTTTTTTLSATTATSAATSTNKALANPTSSTTLTGVDEDDEGSVNHSQDVNASDSVSDKE